MADQKNSDRLNFILGKIQALEEQRLWIENEIRNNRLDLESEYAIATNNEPEQSES